ncbi:MAG: hypothetical protein A4E73_00667 [Syntrophaceae bacterium PtaU1.Bin231]|nr:MAG: hypothetical protein A4E73_00667 [Syntrophaceae bacterium PtaU1.Bin231]
MEHYLGVAGKMGIGDEEIGAVQAIVMAVSAGRVRAQFREVRRRAKVKTCRKIRANNGELADGRKERQS